MFVRWMVVAGITWVRYMNVTFNDGNMVFFVGIRIFDPLGK
jgi:hypothetical protein